MSPQRRFVTLVALCATLLVGLPVAAGADRISSPPDPGVFNVLPEPGAVVEVGSTFVEAVVVAGKGFAEVTLTVDASPVPVALDGSGTAAIASATVDLAPGEHTLVMTVRASDGATRSRGWTLTAVPLPTRRIAGADRYETAARISQAAFPAVDSAAGAVLASGADFPDALAATPLAAAVGGPLLLTAPTRLPSATASELLRALPDGARVHILGGTAAVSEAVADAVASLGFEVQRIAGADRYGTAVAASTLLPAATTAVIASGARFPDALAAASPAARDGMPILLTRPDALPDAVADRLRAQGIATVFVVGGPAVVSDAVIASLRDLGVTVIRLFGPDRYATARAVAERFYGADLSRLALASGAAFPDGLAGGPYAASQALPLLLSPPSGLPSDLRGVAASTTMEEIVVYGGTAALSEDVLDDFRRDVVDRGGPALVSSAPAEGAEINSFANLQFDFDRALDLSRTTVYVRLGVHEVFGTVQQGDFTSTIVFSADSLPVRVEADVPYPVTVVVRAVDGSGTRHVVRHLSYRRLEVGMGDFGNTVAELQQRLIDLGYWLDAVDGTYGRLTSQAIMAFQKAEGLRPTGEVDATTLDRLKTAPRQQPTRFRTGRSIEIDLTRQIMLFIDSGHVEWIMNTSTGNGEYYYVDGQKRGPALTPTGNFRVERQIDGMRESDLGKLWRPKYFVGGFALHGSTSVPSYAASHGCTRLTYEAMDFVWASGIAPIGTPVYVYGRAPGT